MPRVLIPTPAGDARVTWYPAGAAPKAVLVASHGAGGGVEARDLVALATVLPASGVTVALVEQPWKVAGRRVAPAPATLDTAWRALWPTLAEAAAGVPLVAAGRSAGARVACRTAGELGAAAVLALAFPLHPPGRPEKSRAGELAAVRVPLLVVQGERDPFGRPAEFPPGVTVHRVPYADHGFAVPKAAPGGVEAAAEAVGAAAGEWLTGLFG
jgi:predicted alpha/beta-hydrolase family hydrolase